MIFFASCHHGNDQRRAKRQHIAHFFNRFLIVSGSDSALFKNGAKTVAPFSLNHKKCHGCREL